MINEKRIKELEKRLITPNYSNTFTLPKKNTSTPDITKLKKIAKEIRKTVEDYQVEVTPYAYTDRRSK